MKNLKVILPIVTLVWVLGVITWQHFEIRGIKEELQGVKADIMIELPIFGHYYELVYGDDSLAHDSVRLAWVVEELLDHLNVEIDRIPAKRERYELRSTATIK